MSKVDQSDGGLYAFLNILISLLDVACIQWLTNCNVVQQQCYQWWTANKIVKKRPMCNELKTTVTFKINLLTVSLVRYATLRLMYLCIFMGIELLPKRLSKYLRRWSYSATWYWPQFLCRVLERGCHRNIFAFWWHHERAPSCFLKLSRIPSKPKSVCVSLRGLVTGSRAVVPTTSSQPREHQTSVCTSHITLWLLFSCNCFSE